MCRVMRHQRQQAAGMAPILDAAPHHEKACAAVLITESGVHKSFCVMHRISIHLVYGWPVSVIGIEQVFAAVADHNLPQLLIPAEVNA